jgi:hypothetical protein
MTVEQRLPVFSPSQADELSRLQIEHRDLEARLGELNSHVYLTPEEQLERKRIQKLKLQKKDLMQRLQRVSVP